MSNETPKMPGIYGDTSIHPLLKLGGCYACKLSSDSFATVVLISVRKEEDDLYYQFIHGGKIFTTLPDKLQMKQAGIWGRKIPSGVGDNGKFDESILTFSAFSINEQHLKKDIADFTLLDHIDASNTIHIGTSSFVNSMGEISRVIESLVTANKRIGGEPSIIPQYPNEAVAWEKIPLASSNNEKLAPFSIWRLTKKTAHAKAVAVMTEDWYWSGIDDLSPFGNDDGHDAFYSFKSWRDEHPTAEPALFLNELERMWGMSFQHKNIVNEKDLSAIERVNVFYRSVDRGIVAVALGQVMLEGQVSSELKNWGIKACQRALTAYGMQGMNHADQREYRDRLEKIISVLNNY